MTKINQTILYRSIGDEEGEEFQNFELFPHFNINVQPELVNNNFTDEKGPLISSKKCKQQQFRKRILTLEYGIVGCSRTRAMTSIYEGS